jgi:hypothetical protein
MKRQNNATGGAVPIGTESSTKDGRTAQRSQHQQALSQLALNPPGPSQILDRLDPAFLDTIPEDTSVAAGAAYRSAPSTASAVASSTGDDELEQGGGVGERNRHHGGSHKKRGGGGGGSDVSNTGAEVGEGAAPPTGHAGRPSSGRRMSEARKNERRKRILLFGVIVCFLLAGVSAGIVVLLKRSEDEPVEFNGTAAPSPVPIANLAPFNNVFQHSESPTQGREWNEQDIQMLNEALLEISPNATALFLGDESRGEVADTVLPPQAKCRRWFLDKNSNFEYTVDNVGIEQVQQRYILCVLYYSAGGDDNGWTVTRYDDGNTDLVRTAFMSEAFHVCHWDGIFCVQLENTTSTAVASSSSNGNSSYNENESENVTSTRDFVVNSIDLSSSNLVGTLPNELVHLKHIENLIIRDNSELVGTIPTDLFSQMARLKACDLSHNSLTGTIPRPSSSTTPSTSALALLALNDNQLTGTIPIDLFTDLPLQFCRMSSNSLIGPIPTPSSSLQLRELILDDNQLTGSIPFFGNTLEKLLVQENRLSELPFDLYASASSLKVLKAYDNALDGSFATLSSPPWTADNLEWIDVANNSLTGILPDSLWDLPLLRIAHFDWNAIGGTLPSTTNRTSSAMESLWLDSNQLTGTIPSTFGYQWVNLQYLYVQNNSGLTGNVTKTHCNNWTSWVEVKMDCDLAPVAGTCACCACCQECFR